MKWYLTVWKNYTQFKGRAGLAEYWIFTLIHLLTCALLYIAILWSAGAVISTPDNSTLQSAMQMRGNILVLIFGIYILATIIPWLAVTCRRLHDSDMSGFWVLVTAIENGWIFLCLLLLRGGTSGPNRYGENPKTIEISETPQE